MDSTDRIIGELKEAKRTTMARLDKIEVKIDDLYKVRWQIAGGATVISVIITSIIQFLRGN